MIYVNNRFQVFIKTLTLVNLLLIQAIFKIKKIRSRIVVVYLQEMHTLLECHVELDLEGYEDKNMQTGEETGIKLTIHCNHS